MRAGMIELRVPPDRAADRFFRVMRRPEVHRLKITVKSKFLFCPVVCFVRQILYDTNRTQHGRAA